MTTTLKSKQALMWAGGSIIGGGLLLTILGMAAQFWISTEVSAQLGAVEIPNTGQLTTDVEVMKGDIANISNNVNTVVESQQRFEELFIDYLQKQAE